MSKAIVTTTLPATDTKPTRISAKMEGCKRLTISMDCDLDHDTNHRIAAKKLLERIGAKGTLQGGEIQPGKFAFVLVPSIRYRTHSGAFRDHPARLSESEARELGAPESWL